MRLIVFIDIADVSKSMEYNMENVAQIIHKVIFAYFKKNY